MIGSFEVEGNIVNIETQTISHGKVIVKDGKIENITSDRTESIDSPGPFIMPGFIDAHIHIEDTLIPPYEFGRFVVQFGNVASVCDPHEIANVMGISGIKYMIEEGKKSPYKFFNGAPSSVPATDFETNGANLGPKEIEELMSDPDITHLSEFMRFMEVIERKEYDMAKIEIAKKVGKPIDGHCPMLSGEGLDKYISAGISTEHECSTLEEAREKAKKGMKIIVRQGSAAHNLDQLYPIINEYPDTTMLCTDDIHAYHIVYGGYINSLVKTAIGYGCNLFNVLRASAYNTVKHYNLPVGLLRTGDPADFIIVEDLKKFKVLKTYIDGKLVYDSPNLLIPAQPSPIVNNFNIDPITKDDIVIKAEGTKMHAIELIDKQLITNDIIVPVTVDTHNNAISNPNDDILKIVDLSRYGKSKPGIGFIKGYGLKSGALAFSISHDAHNIICVGVEDDDIVTAINLVITNKGGASISDKGKTKILPLPIGGLMSVLPVEEIAKENLDLEETAKAMGSKLTAPFATLSFMGLTVIPFLKLSDKGIFDAKTMKLINIFKVE